MISIMMHVRVEVDEATWASEYNVPQGEVLNDVETYYEADTIRDSLNAARTLGPVASVRAVSVTVQG